MSEPSAAGPLAWVSKRDGRLEPFDADKICQSLFAVGEATGAANAFLARELTDAVVHFLSSDASAAPMLTTMIAEQVEKVARELGQPEMALAYAQSMADRPHPEAVPPRASAETGFQFSLSTPPEDVARQCLESYALQAVFTRDLAAAHRDGLIGLGGLQAPRRLESRVADAIEAHGGLDLCGGVADALAVTGGAVVLDGPEWQLAQEETPGSFLWLLNLPRLVDRQVVVNANSEHPPAWAHQNAGPLFAAAASRNEPSGLLRRLIDESAHRPDARLAWRWHLSGRDFSPDLHDDSLTDIAQKAAREMTVTFVFDRPRRSPALAEGIDRASPALLMEIGLDLSALFGQPAIGGDLRTFLAKLPSLARMAISAGGQKRKYLRQHGNGQSLVRGFLIDRAQILVRVIGLDRLTHALTGQAVGDGPAALELALTILRTLQAALTEAGRVAHLAVALDATAASEKSTDTPSAKQQLSSAGKLHAVTGWGTALVPMPANAAELIELLAFAWKRTDAASVRFQQT